MKGVNSKISNENLYYMLCYAYDCPWSESIVKHDLHSCNNALDLLALILYSDVVKLLKRGLIKGYTLRQDNLQSIKGKLVLSDTLMLQARGENKANCEYDEFSNDIVFNQIIKAAINKLLINNINKDTKRKIRVLLLYFQDVSEIDINSINWRIQFDRTNSHYRMLLVACKLILQNLLFASSKGRDSAVSIFDEQYMHRLFEKFILNYYRQEHKELDEVYSKQIEWSVGQDCIDDFLPSMQSDIYLRRGDDVLIIDTKYYDSITSTHYAGAHGKFHSHNLYQIFTYVKNEASNQPARTVSGMLLYAKPDDSELNKRHDYVVDGNIISVMPLDLTNNWKKLKSVLDNIVLTLHNQESRSSN